MEVGKLPLDQVILGDCVQVLSEFPEKSVDLVFADPPYNLQLRQELWRPNMTKVDAVDDSWDKFGSLEDYDKFSYFWLEACRRVLKETGTIWVIGTYHNIYRIGSLMQDLGFWFLNDVIWIKTNPMPNFRGVRFANAHEILLWACKSKGTKYTFNYHAMKTLNGDLQMRSDWVLPICTGSERVRVKGKKAHSTQKPEALLYRVILAASNPGDVILDPFFGSGTTGVVAARLHRRWIGIEKQDNYVKLANERIAGTAIEPYDAQVFDIQDKKRLEPRIPFSSLLENGLLTPGQSLFFKKDRSVHARLKPDGKLTLDGLEGSIHQLGRHLVGGGPCNGWDHWYFETDTSDLQPINDLRKVLRKQLKESNQ